MQLLPLFVQFNSRSLLKFFLCGKSLDFRFDAKKAKFRQKFLGLSDDKASYLFDSDGYDSDGDGLTNLEERVL